jgi:hypothetical protein
MGRTCTASCAELSGAFVPTVTVTAGVQTWALQRAPALPAQQQQLLTSSLHTHPPTRLFLPLSLLSSPVVI